MKLVPNTNVREACLDEPTKWSEVQKDSPNFFGLTSDKTDKKYFELPE